jgi:hypothetical protein
MQDPRAAQSPIPSHPEAAKRIGVQPLKKTVIIPKSRRGKPRNPKVPKANSKPHFWDHRKVIILHELMVIAYRRSEDVIAQWSPRQMGFPSVRWSSVVFEIDPGSQLTR